MDRLQEHFYNVNKKSLDHSVSRHFNEPGHSGIQDMDITILDFIHQHPESKGAAYLRNKIETNWIHRLKCQAPYGLNMLE